MMKLCVEPSFVPAYRVSWNSRCAGYALAQSPPRMRCQWPRRSIVVEGMDASSVDGRTTARRAIDVGRLEPERGAVRCSRTNMCSSVHEDKRPGKRARL